jgi:ABC-type branched-subunit amino acid transport system substrate-binding protein
VGPIPVGATAFVEPVIPNYFIFNSNFKAEGKIMAKYAVETLGKQKLGVFYQNDDFGKDFLLGAEEYAKEKGIELAAVSSYNTTDIDFSSAALKMKEAGVDAIIFGTVVKPAAQFALELAKLDVKAQILASSVTGGDVETMHQLAGDAWEGALSPNFGGMPSDDTPEMREFRDLMKKAYPNDSEYSGTALRGFMIAEIMAEALKRAGDNLTWENLIKTFETFDNWSGVYAKNVTYTPDDHRGVTMVHFLQNQGGKNVRITDDIPLY